MSQMDKNSFQAPQASELAKKAADAGGVTDQVNQKLTEATAPLFEAAQQAQFAASEIQQGLSTLSQKYSDIPDSELFKPLNNFTVTPPEVLEKELREEASKYYAKYGGDIASQLQNSHIVYATIQIGGQDVLKDSHFTLDIHQRMADHDEFMISCYAEAFGDKNAYPMTHSRNLLGKKCTLQFKQFGQSAYVFTGIITEISNKKVDGHNKLFIRGHAPTILLENGQDCESFEEQGLEAIIRKATGEYPQDLVAWDLRPNLKDPLKYTVQYRESDWNFVKRLAVRYGEWLYYNGQKIVFGGSGGKTEELVEEQDIYSYELSMRLVPQKFTYVGYDAKQAKNHTVNSDSVPITHQLVNPFQQHAIKASEEVYSKVPLSLYNQSLLEKGEPELKEAVKRQKLSRQNVFFLEARTNNPNLRLGDIVKMKAWMPGHEIFKNGEVPLESYKVIEISHHQDITEGYYNQLIGVPMDNEVPAYMDENAIPECEEQSAIVMDNNDPDGMSRIRVQFAWQKPFNGMTPWIRSITPYAGSGKGMHVVPEIGEEVIVSFENGNAEKPVSLGAMFNGKGKSGHGGAGNYMKGLQTPTGNKLLFNDKEGSALLTDNGGVNMKFDGAGNATTNANKIHSVNAGTNANTSVGEDASTLKMDKDGNITLEGNTNITLKVGENTIVIDQKGLTFTNKDGNSVAITPEGITNTAKIGKMKSTAEAGTVSIESTSDSATFKGSTDTNIGGGSMTYVTGGEVEINQS
ncbi:contractile injection system protein, VgrG/Pvc8 family [Apibacter raozihei]|uniref:type VI secretion system Vgr family protein n=1 Tax=Apibacter raozihei TaxID=2500547 RepID=UPI000FE3AE27|nr:contractile injection system protein, VgrG/Pvc8 family [Apibacter raozihei]